jgi:hypothetical protein
MQIAESLARNLERLGLERRAKGCRHRGPARGHALALAVASRSRVTLYSLAEQASNEAVGTGTTRWKRRRVAALESDVPSRSTHPRTAATALRRRALVPGGGTLPPAPGRDEGLKRRLRDTDDAPHVHRGQDALPDQPIDGRAAEVEPGGNLSNTQQHRTSCNMRPQERNLGDITC